MTHWPWPLPTITSTKKPSLDPGDSALDFVSNPNCVRTGVEKRGTMYNVADGCVAAGAWQWMERAVAATDECPLPGRRADRVSP